MIQLDLLADLIGRARAAGADSADALLSNATAVRVTRRLRQTEQLTRAETQKLGLRVFVGRRSAGVSATEVDPAQFPALVERALAMAKVVPEDPYGGLADETGASDGAVLDLEDPHAVDADTLLERAAAAEEAALAIPGITNSEGATASYGRVETALVTSAGFAGRTARTGHSISAAVVAGSGTAMQRDYDFSSAVHLADLDDPAAIGRTAAEKAIARLEPRRPKTARMPVVFDPRVAPSLIGHLAAAISGAAITRGTSFLKDQLGQRVFAPGITVRDDPHRPRGLRSHAFDSEGVGGRALDLVADGVLTTWLLDSRTARMLGLATTGHASRDGGGSTYPTPSNLYLEPGRHTVADLMADIKEGLYVTEMMGTSVSMITGDYSRGAAGFMIRDGALAEPVAELTIAGTLQEIFRSLVPAADLRFRFGTDSPTVRVDGLTVAGA